MTTRKKVKAEQVAPQVRLFISEDTRQEVNGKVSVIGLFADNVIVLHMPDEIPDPTESAPLYIKSLSFLINVTKLSESVAISADIEANGTRKPILPPRIYEATSKQRSVSIVMNMQPCAVVSFGEKKVIVKVDQLEFAFPFEMRRESIQIDAPAAEKNVASTTKRMRPSKKKEVQTA